MFLYSNNHKRTKKGVKEAGRGWGWGVGVWGVKEVHENWGEGGKGMVGIGREHFQIKSSRKTMVVFKIPYWHFF